MTPHDQVVTPRHILEAQSILERIGTGRSLQELESREPELASYVMEHLTIIHGHLMQLGGSARKSQCTYQKMETLFLLCLQAQRAAYRELLDSDDAAEARPPPTRIVFVPVHHSRSDSFPTSSTAHISVAERPVIPCIPSCYCPCCGSSLEVLTPADPAEYPSPVFPCPICAWSWIFVFSPSNSRQTSFNSCDPR